MRRGGIRPVPGGRVMRTMGAHVGRIGAESPPRLRGRNRISSCRDLGRRDFLAPDLNNRRAHIFISRAGPLCVAVLSENMGGGTGARCVNDGQ